MRTAESETHALRQGVNVHTDTKVNVQSFSEVILQPPGNMLASNQLIRGANGR